MFFLNALKNELFVFNDPEYSLIFFKLIIFFPEFFALLCVMPAPWHLQKHAFESFWNMLSVLLLIVEPMARGVNYKPSYWDVCVNNGKVGLIKTMFVIIIVFPLSI